MLDSQPTLRYCLYARKSSESDERQAMSIDSQLAEMRALAENEGLDLRGPSSDLRGPSSNR